MFDRLRALRGRRRGRGRTSRCALAKLAADFDQRVQAVQAFRQLPGRGPGPRRTNGCRIFSAKSEDEVPPNVDASLLVEAAEKALGSAGRTPKS
ncbi:hypothetical protein ACPA9J_24530 [Pseudomonas aeruginosa]